MPTLPEHPLVSVCIINYNQGRFFKDCLESFLSQTYKNTELIIIDDCSTDNSADIIKLLLAENNVQAKFIINTENKGICKNINKAIRESRGKYFSVVACDDYYGKHRFEKLVSAAKNLPDDYKVVFSNCNTVDEVGNLISKDFIGEIRPDLKKIPDGRIYFELLQNNFIPAIAMLIKKDVFKKVGLFDESLKLEDYDMWLRIARKYRFKYAEDNEVYYRQVNNSLIKVLSKSHESLKENFYFFAKHTIQKDRIIRDLIMDKLKYYFETYKERTGKNDKRLEFDFSKARFLYKWQGRIFSS